MVSSPEVCTKSASISCNVSPSSLSGSAGVATLEARPPFKFAGVCPLRLLGDEHALASARTSAPDPSFARCCALSKFNEVDDAVGGDKADEGKKSNNPTMAPELGVVMSQASLFSEEGTSSASGTEGKSPARTDGQKLKIPRISLLALLLCRCCYAFVCC